MARRKELCVDSRWDLGKEDEIKVTQTYFFFHLMVKDK